MANVITGQVGVHENSKTEMGHIVKLMPCKAVKAFVGGNKNDAADARATWLAVQQASVKAPAKASAMQAFGIP